MTEKKKKRNDWQHLEHYYPRARTLSHSIWFVIRTVARTNSRQRVHGGDWSRRARAHWPVYRAVRALCRSADRLRHVTATDGGPPFHTAPPPPPPTRAAVGCPVIIRRRRRRTPYGSLAGPVVFLPVRFFNSDIVIIIILSHFSDTATSPDFFSSFYVPFGSTSGLKEKKNTTLSVFFFSIFRPVK